MNTYPDNFIKELIKKHFSKYKEDLEKNQFKPF